MIRIIAGHRRDAEMLADRLGLISNRWTWIDEDVRLFGLAPGTVVFELETASDLPRYQQIMDVCMVRDFQVCRINLDHLVMQTRHRR